MIPRALEAEILRLHHTEHWPIGTIATQLRVHHSTVRRVLAQAGVPAAQNTVRASLAEPYLAFMVETLAKFPTLRASRLYTMVRERGYPGAPDHFRAIVARLRPRPAGEAYLRLRTLPGEQAQVDGAHFGKLTIGRAERPLMAFVMVLSYSRHLFLRFYLGAEMSYFLRGHVEAFARYHSVPRVLLYDNLKSAVLERRDEAIRFHPTLLELAAHYRFQPRPVAVARGNEKAAVEASVLLTQRWILARLRHRQFFCLEELNAAIRSLLLDLNARPFKKLEGSRQSAFATIDRPAMKPLPATRYQFAEWKGAIVNIDYPVEVDGHYYSVPHALVKQKVDTRTTATTVECFHHG